MTQFKNNDPKPFFKSLSPQLRLLWKAKYEHLIAIEKDKLIEYNKLTGKPVNYIKMPWMLPAWEQGLKIINEVITESKSLSHNS